MLLKNSLYTRYIPALALCVLVILSPLLSPKLPAFGEETEEAREEAVPPEMTAADVVPKALTAYGGKEALAQVVAQSTMHGRKITELDGDKVEVAYRLLRKGEKWRLDLESIKKTESGGGGRSRKDSSSGEQAGGDADQATPAGDADQSAATSGAAQSAATSGADGQSDSALSGTRSDTASSAASSAKTVLEVTACDGKRAWRSQGNDVSDLSKEEFDFIDEKVENQPTLLTLFQDEGVDFQLIGRTNYKQVPVYAVQISRKDDSPTTLYLDQKNYLVVALSYKRKESGSAKPTGVCVEFSEYRPTGGTLLPFRQTEYVDEKPSYELEITSASIGQAIDDASFDRPKQEGRYKLDRNVVVPFEYSQNEIVIKGRVNNSDDLVFLFDTGASDTIIDRRVAAQNFLSKQGQFDIAGYAGLVAAQRSQLRRLELGGLVLNDVPVRILDLNQQSRQMGRNIAGIIGTNIISQFVVTIDYSKPSLTFGDLDSFERPAKAYSVPFVYKQLPFVKVSLNGKDEQILLVDTGAAFNHLPEKVAQRHVVGDPANMRHVTEGTGLDGRPVHLGRVVVDTLNIGGATLRSVAFTYPMESERAGSRRPQAGTTPERQERTGFFQNSSFGILGNPFWQNFVVVVDYRFQRLLLIQNQMAKLKDDIEQAMTAGDQKLVVHRDYRAAEASYQRALILLDSARDSKMQAAVLGRMGNLRRIMAKDLNRPEHAKSAYQYFVKGQEIARKVGARDVEGRIIADWSLLYSDNGQRIEAKQTIERAIQLAPQDPNVNVDYAVHLYRAKLYPEMQRYVQKALFLEPSNWQALWYQLKLSEMFYDTPRAVATLKEILRFYPWSKVAADKLSSIKDKPAIVVPATQQPGGMTVTPWGGPAQAPGAAVVSPWAPPPHQPGAPMVKPWAPSVPNITPSPQGANVPRVTPWTQQKPPPKIPMIVPGKATQPSQGL